MRRFLTLSALLLSSTAPLFAQGAGGMAMATPTAGRLAPAPSPRATTVMTLSTNVRGAAPMKVTIDYGQPFARGRAVEGGLIPSGTVWRTGANAATSLVTDVALRIGTLMVPKGAYTLFTQWSQAAGMQLIVSKQTGQWGTEYQAGQDLGRTAMTARTLNDVHDAFTIILEPGMATSGPAAATLRLTWGKTEFSAPVIAVP